MFFCVKWKISDFTHETSSSPTDSCFQLACVAGGILQGFDFFWQQEIPTATRYKDDCC